MKINKNDENTLSELYNEHEILKMLSFISSGIVNIYNRNHFLLKNKNDGWVLKFKPSIWAKGEWFGNDLYICGQDDYLIYRIDKRYFSNFGDFMFEIRKTLVENGDNIFDGEIV